MLRFSANLMTLFPKAPLLERFQKAANAGFDVVEIWSPQYEGLADAIKKAGVKLLQFNLDMGDFPAGERGLLSLPDQKTRFRVGFQQAIYFAGQLGVRQINTLVGNRIPSYSGEQQLDCMKDNLEWLHPQLETNDIKLYIEPINTFHSKNYLIGRPDHLFSLLKAFNLPRIGVQYDIFHAQLMTGNLLSTIRENFDLIGHIQIADAPGRHQPGTGEINYRFLFKEIEAMGYNGYIGLEYNPLGSTIESLAWLPFNCRICCRADQLLL